MSEDSKRGIAKYFKYWRVLLILAGIVLAVFAYVRITYRQKAEQNGVQYYESTNTERVYGDRRVFDYADQLTDSEEEALEEYIHRAEQKTCTDIVIVTLNQSLADYAADYAAGYDMQITPDKYVMVYADKFWEDNRFGYDSPQVLDGTSGSGDGVLLVDNLYREPETGRIYTWMCTTGIVEDRFSSYMINDTLDVFYERVDYDYYQACRDFVDCYVDYMLPDVVSLPTLGHRIAYIAGLIIMLVYCLINCKGRSGTVTVTDRTYIEGNAPEFTENSDVFLRKNVSRVYDPPADSGNGSRSGGGSHGGGGHHISGGGGSHGGGGHSR